MTRLTNESYMAFPFRIGDRGVATSARAEHVRQQIEQVLLTNPGERVFRPDFGAGMGALVFEPNTSVLAELTRKRLLASLTEALRGEVDPKTLQVDVQPDLQGGGETLRVTVSYTLAAIGHTEQHQLIVGHGGQTHG
jgi:phage baseplate assembly protein W